MICLRSVATRIAPETCGNDIAMLGLATGKQRYQMISSRIAWMIGLLVTLHLHATPIALAFLSYDRICA
jgi:hypothetical protein